MKLACVELTVGIAKVNTEFSLSEPKSLWWTTLAEWVSSTRMMSAGHAAPDSRNPLSCAATSSESLDGLETQSGPCKGVHSHSPRPPVLLRGSRQRGEFIDEAPLRQQSTLN